MLKTNFLRIKLKLKNKFIKNYTIKSLSSFRLHKTNSYFKPKLFLSEEGSYVHISPIDSDLRPN